MDDQNDQATNSAQPELTTFLEFLTKHFIRDELMELFLQLEVGYDALPGEGTRAKSLALIYYMGRHGRLNELRQAAASLRDHVDWPDLSQVSYDFSANPSDTWLVEAPFSERSEKQQLIDRFKQASRQEMRIVGGKYIPSLYFARMQVETNFKRFLDSDAVCFLVVAKAGRGKTNLMCHLVDELQDERPTLFLSGRLEPRDSYGVLKHVAGRLGFGDDWAACFQAVKSLAAGGPQPLILIDGINESAAEPAEMQAALRELLIQSDSEIKICVTCRTDFWKFYRAPFWSEYTWQEDGAGLGRRVVRGEDLALFPEDDFQGIVEAYLEFFEVQGTLIEEAWERCRNPLLLRFFCEAYRKKRVGPVAQIRLYPLFKLYWEQKVGNVQDLTGLPEQYEVNRFVLTVARMMRQRYQTRVPRDELETEFGGALAKPDSLYYRVLDEEIILEEEVDDLVGRTNVIFVYDKFSEYAIALSIFSDFRLDTKGQDEMVSEFQRWMQEETDHQFATLRGALEFLVLCVEDRRDTEWLHFDLIRAMLGFDWKWRRMGAVLAWQLARTDDARFWQFGESLVTHERDFVKRISAEQLVSLSRYQADRVLPLLNLCLEDDSSSVRQAARVSLLNLEAEAAIREVQLLAEQRPLGDASLPLAAELLLWPFDGRSPTLLAKTHWLVMDNQDQAIQEAVLDRLQDLEREPRILLFTFEELQRALRVGWSRESKPGNVYLDFIDEELHQLSPSLESDFQRLQCLREIVRPLVDLAVAEFDMRRSSPELVLQSTLEILAPEESRRKSFLQTAEGIFQVSLGQTLSDMEEYLGADENGVFGSLTLGRLALEVARQKPEFLSETLPFQLVDLPPVYQLDDAEDLAGLCLLADELCRDLAAMAGKSFDEVNLSTELGGGGVSLEPEKRLAFLSGALANIGAELTTVEQRTLTNVGRLALWLWHNEQQLKAHHDNLKTRAETIEALSVERLQERLSVFENISPPQQMEEELAVELQSMCRALAESQIGKLTTALTPLIVWHYENDSSVVGRSFQSLYWRDRDMFWDVANALLEHEDQRVIDFASQVLERAEYDEEQGGMAEVVDRVRAITADLLGIYEQDITPSVRLREDLEADSLDLVELVMALEDEFGLEISDEELERIYTIGDAVSIVSQLMQTS